MSFLVVLLGFGVGFFGLAIVVAVLIGDYEGVAGLLILETILVWPFIVCLKKYRSPEYQAKLKKRQRIAQDNYAKWQAEAPERERMCREEKARKQESKRLHTTIVATRLIGEGSAEYKKSVGSMMMRGAVGGFFAGAAGATLGMATAKNKNTNKNVRRFLVKYLDGHIEEKEATIGSSDYEIYMAHLEWEE